MPPDQDTTSVLLTTMQTMLDAAKQEAHRHDQAIQSNERIHTIVAENQHQYEHMIKALSEVEQVLYDLKNDMRAIAIFLQAMMNIVANWPGANKHAIDQMQTQLDRLLNAATRPITINTGDSTINGPVTGDVGTIQK